MGGSSGPNIRTKDLVFCIDYADPNSYPGTGTDLFDCSNNEFTVGDIKGLGAGEGNGFTNQFFGGINTTSSVADTKTIFANIPNSSVLTFFTGSYTLEAVFSPSGFADSTYFGLENVIIAKGGFSTLNYLMQINATQLTHCKRTPGESLIFDDFSTTFTSGSVYHCVLSISPDGNEVTGYQNGVKLGTATIGGLEIGPDSDGSDPFYVPASGGTGDPIEQMNFQGTLFTARIYSASLSEDDVIQNYNALKGRFKI